MNKIYSDETLKSLYYSLPIFEKMLEDRKYIPLYTGIPKTDIIQRMNNRKYETPSNNLAMVIIANCTGDIKLYTDYICDPNYETILCIYTNNINISHKKMEKTFDYKIEIWPLIHLYIADHIFQPKIEVINTKELEEFKNGKIQPIKLPKISYYDPIIRYYKIKHKSIIKIYETDRLISYRIVI